MAESLKVVALSGSLRKGSYNTALLRIAQGLAPAGMLIEIAEIGDLPLYNEDFDGAAAPAPVQRLRGQIKSADALLFAVTEYNYSVSGVLKNAIDWASRPMRASSLSGKPVALMGAANSLLGTSRAQYHLRQMCIFNDMHPVNRPEVYVSGARQKFDDNGNLNDAAAKELIGQLLANLLPWTAAIKGMARDAVSARPNSTNSHG